MGGVNRWGDGGGGRSGVKLVTHVLFALAGPVLLAGERLELLEDGVLVLVVVGGLVVHHVEEC